MSVEVTSRAADMDDETSGMVTSGLAFCFAFIGAAIAAWALSFFMDPGTAIGKIVLAVAAIVAAGASWVLGCFVLVAVAEFPAHLAPARLTTQLHADVVTRLAHSEKIQRAD